MKNNKPRSMHCDWAMMRDETNWDKTDDVPELRGRLDKIREGFENAVESPFAAIDEAIATHRAPIIQNNSLEEQAAAFCRKTGMVAPFKDSRDGAFTEEERNEAWKEWVVRNKPTP